MAQSATDAVRRLLADWHATRAELAAIERAEHPDVVDRHGRVWTWWKGDLYRHDDTLAFPLEMIQAARFGLPGPRLADNPNYRRLCETCRSRWPGHGQVHGPRRPGDDPVACGPGDCACGHWKIRHGGGTHEGICLECFAATPGQTPAGFCSIYRPA
jgi:hypothetical protein